MHVMAITYSFLLDLLFGQLLIQKKTIADKQNLIWDMRIEGQNPPDKDVLWGSVNGLFTVHDNFEED
jgi:hypothetical protein